MRKKTLVFILTFYISCILIVSPSFTNNVLAVSYSTSFEDGTINNDYNSYWLDTYAKYGVAGHEFEIENNNPRTGSLNFYILGTADDLADGWFNYTYSSEGYLTEWHIWINLVSGHNDNFLKFTFSNETGTTIIEILLMRTVVQYYDHNGALQSYGYEVEGAFTRYGFEIIDNQTVNYYNSSLNYTEGTPRNILDIDFMRITSCFLDIDTTGGNHYYDMDDHIITVNATIGDESPTGDDVSNFQKYCEGDAGVYTSTFVNNRYIENEFTAEMTANIEAVDLFISNDQYNYVSGDSLDYELVVNGENIGNPVIFSTGSNMYTMRWSSFTVSITDQRPVFEFMSSSYYLLGSSYYYWYGLGIKSDGGELRYHNNMDLYGNGLYDGTQHSYGLAMCFYYTQAQPYVPTINDSVNTIPIGQTEYEEWEQVFFEYTLNTLSPNSYAQLYKDTVRYEDNGFDGDGLYLPIQIGTFSFTPESDHEGSWQVRIVRAGVTEASQNFTVINRSDDNYYGQIKTVPNPTESNKGFTISWIYNETYYGYEGAIVYTTTPYFGSTFYSILYGVKDAGNVNYNGFAEIGQYYIWLCTNDDGNLSNIAFTVHYVGSIFINEIYTDKSHYQIQDVAHKDVPTAVIHIEGTHSILNGEVYVLIDDGNQLKHYVGGYNVIDLEHEIAKAGYYFLELVYYDNTGNKTVLDSTYFTVGAYEEEMPTGIRVLIRNAFPDPVTRVLTGMGICLLITFLPFLTSLKLKQAHVTINIPTILYGICFGIGTVVSYIVGFFEFEIMFFLCFVLTSIIVVLFLIGRKTPSEG